MRYATTLLILLLSSIYAETLNVKLPHVLVDVTNQKRVERGAQFFVQNCQACHTMKYLKFDPISVDAGVSMAKVPTWPESAWGGHHPPDLSLITITRGADWVYAYLKGYYFEDGQFRNIVMPETQMPNPYPHLQGKQILNMPMEKIQAYHPRLYLALRLEQKGSIPAHEFNEKVEDLMYYLVYASDPSAVDRAHMAPYVMLFLGLFALFAFFLYKEFRLDD